MDSVLTTDQSECPFQMMEITTTMMESSCSEEFGQIVKFYEVKELTDTQKQLSTVYYLEKISFFQ